MIELKTPEPTSFTLDRGKCQQIPAGEECIVNIGFMPKNANPKFVMDIFEIKYESGGIKRSQNFSISAGSTDS